MDFFTTPLKDHSIGWLLLSAVFGGAIGSALQSLFAEVINPTLRQRWELGRIVHRYTLPILRSADALQGRIANILQYANQGHPFAVIDDDEYRFSSLYLFGQF